MILVREARLKTSRGATHAVAVAIALVAALIGAASANAYLIVNEYHWPANPAKGTLLYCFQNGTPDIAGNGEREAIRAAMNTWEAAAPRIQFVETSYCPFATIWIKWNPGFVAPSPGSIDIVGESVGYVHTAPPPNGDIIFDEAETWTLSSRPFGSPQPLDLQQIALHALGHSLGLGDSDWTFEWYAMNPTYWGSYRVLSEDEINGMKAMYTDIT